MRGFALAASLALALSAAPAFAQQPRPVQPAPARPAAPPPAQPAQTAPTPAQRPPAPFPQGAKVAYVYLQQIAALSSEGKAAQATVTAFTQKKQMEVADKTKALQASQQKLQTGGGVMSDVARAQLEKDIERQQRDLERLQQDAQGEITEKTQEVQADFNKKLFPILEQLSVEKGLHLLFSAQDAGLIWAADGLDLTMDAVRKLDAATAAAKGAPAASVAPPPAPAAPAPAVPAPPAPAAPAPK
jgi:Skp family chaperone for outer membrane proteins